ncbi:uncharacterized protein LOC128273687 [Anopheles cruzii]|uniref:uncharacterized protein LOC128273687 n=1 Tax=Anopheles cruzii TaxID=68878 RepID=UPI0022EC1EBB|nr:uncharacterized protein LOC128273687 [Anopheles cruzii]
MFWVLWRTGAANLFNSINGNQRANKTGSTYSSNSDRSHSRPPRKAYGRLSSESDDAQAPRTDYVPAPVAQLIDLDGTTTPDTNCDRYCGDGEGNGNDGYLITPGSSFACDSISNNSANNNQCDDYNNAEQYHQSGGLQLAHRIISVGVFNSVNCEGLEDPPSNVVAADVNRNHTDSCSVADLELDSGSTLPRLQAMACSDDDDYGIDSAINRTLHEQ